MNKRVGYTGLRNAAKERAMAGLNLDLSRDKIVAMLHDEVIVDYAQKIDLHETDVELQRRLEYVTGEKITLLGEKLEALAARYGLQRRERAKLMIGVDPGMPEDQVMFGYAHYDGVVHRIKDLA